MLSAPIRISGEPILNSKSGPFKARLRPVIKVALRFEGFMLGLFKLAARAESRAPERISPVSYIRSSPRLRQ
jgi:hypothetical protein